MQTHVRSRAMWLPLVLVGSVLYWSVALGLGGRSLSLLGASNEEDLALQPTTVTEEPIVVRLQSLSELHGAGGNPATVDDDGTGRLPATDDSPPPPPPEDPIGRTSY